MRVRHPPGRGGRLWLADRLDLARRATDLLVQKERVLLREQRRLVVLHRRTLARVGGRVPRGPDVDRARRCVARPARHRPARTPGRGRRPTSCGATRWARTTPPRRRARLPDDGPTGDFAGTAAMTERTCARTDARSSAPCSTPRRGERSPRSNASSPRPGAACACSSGTGRRRSRRRCTTSTSSSRNASATTSCTRAGRRREEMLP